MTFSEQLPSKQWAALTFRGERVAEVWFKPEGEPLALSFRVPQSSFQLPGIGPRLTPENLLTRIIHLRASADGRGPGETWSAAAPAAVAASRRTAPFPPETLALCGCQPLATGRSAAKN